MVASRSDFCEYPTLSKSLFMSPTHNEPNETRQAQPMQIGVAPDEVAGLIEEIGYSGVASSPVQVEEMGVLDRDHEANHSEEPSRPIITSD